MLDFRSRDNFLSFCGEDLEIVFASAMLTTYISQFIKNSSEMLWFCRHRHVLIGFTNYFPVNG